MEKIKVAMLVKGDLKSNGNICGNVWSRVSPNDERFDFSNAIVVDGNMASDTLFAPETAAVVATGDVF